MNVDIMYNTQGAIKGGWHDRGMRWPKWLTENRLLAGIQIVLGILSLGGATLVTALLRSFSSLPWLYLAAIFLLVAGCFGALLYALAYRVVPATGSALLTTVPKVELPSPAQPGTDGQIRMVGQRVLGDLTDIRRRVQYALDAMTESRTFASDLLDFEYWWWEDTEIQGGAGGANLFWQEATFSEAHKPVREAFAEAHLIRQIMRREAKTAVPRMDRAGLEKLLARVTEAEWAVEGAVEGLDSR